RQMSADAAVRRDFARRDRLYDVENLVTKHERPLFQIRFEQPPQLLLCAVKLSLERSQRQLQRFRQILVLHTLQIMSGDQQTIVGRQALDRFLEAIAQLEIVEPP